MPRKYKKEFPESYLFRHSTKEKKLLAVLARKMGVSRAAILRLGLALVWEQTPSSNN